MKLIHALSIHNIATGLRGSLKNRTVFSCHSGRTDFGVMCGTESKESTPCGNTRSRRSWCVVFMIVLVLLVPKRIKGIERMRYENLIVAHIPDGI